MMDRETLARLIGDLADASGLAPGQIVSVLFGEAAWQWAQVPGGVWPKRVEKGIAMFRGMLADEVAATSLPEAMIEAYHTEAHRAAPRRHERKEKIGCV